MAGTAGAPTNGVRLLARLLDAVLIGSRRRFVVDLVVGGAIVWLLSVALVLPVLLALHAWVFHTALSPDTVMASSFGGVGGFIGTQIRERRRRRAEAAPD